MTLLHYGVILQLLALTVWTGGVFALLFVRGGNVFAGSDDSRDIRARMARRFSGAEVIAGLLLLTGGGMLYLADVETRYVACNIATSGLMYLLFIIYGFGISQRMEILRASLSADGVGEATVRDHCLRRLSTLSGVCTFLMAVNLLLGVAQVVLLVYVLGLAAHPAALPDDASMNLFSVGGSSAF